MLYFEKQVPKSFGQNQSRRILMKKNLTLISVASRMALALILATVVVCGIVSCDSAIRSISDVVGSQPVQSVSREAVDDPYTWRAIEGPNFEDIFGNSQLNAVGYHVAGRYLVASDTGTLAFSIPFMTPDPGSDFWYPVSDPGVNGNAIWSINSGIVDGSPATLITAAGGYAAYSTDAVTWTTIRPLGSTFTDTFYAAAYSTELDIWVVGGYHGAAAYSNDGLNWTPITDLENIFLPNGSIIRGIAVGTIEDPSGDPANDTTYFVAVGGTSGPRPMPNAAAYSTDGKNWTSIPNGIFCKPVVFGNGTFVAAGYNIDSGVTYNAAYLPLTGTSWNWTPLTTAQTGINGWAQALAFGTKTFVMGGANGTISYSTDGGLTWKPTDTQYGYTGIINGMGYVTSADGTGYFIAVGSNGQASWAAE
jgi:hypothetical protein